MWIIDHSGKQTKGQKMTDADFATYMIECAAKEKAVAAYKTLVSEIDAVWSAATTGQYLGDLTDAGADSENSEHEVLGSSAYWVAMHASAASSAGLRAEQHGYDINSLLGRSIY
jgi:hypothetical protein